MTRGSAAPLAGDNPVDAIELRALSSLADYAACVQLQRETWGADYADTVPASLLKVSQLVGGVSGGAFATDGTLLGFVFGLTGMQGGSPIHWSHMLAVRPECRDHGLGRQLKEYQREVLRGQGVKQMCWTFDPLVARNAHLNLNRLHTTVREYVPDMYGETGSGLHAFGTDRFVVSWPIDAPADAPAPAIVVPGGIGSAGAARGSAPGRGADGVVDGLDDGVVDGLDDGVVDGLEDGGQDGDAATVRVEIPADVTKLSIRDARAWRMRTRPQFIRLLGDGYRVTGFFRDGHDRCFYELSRERQS